MDKTQLRAWAKEKRSQLPIAELSPRVCQHLAHFLQQNHIQHILTYQAFSSEIALERLQHLYPAHYYLPRVEREQLHIHPLPTQLIQHKYGMLEPSPNSATVEAGVLEAVLVPGLVFDSRGYRLGYGKGFYDRFLAELNPKVLTIGVVAEALEVESLPADAWDVAVKYLASELGVISIEHPKL